MRFKCVKNGVEEGTFWTRYVTFPFPPFSGMVVGADTVEQVMVCQFDLDGEGDVEVHLNPAEPNCDWILEANGWELHHP